MVNDYRKSIVRRDTWLAKQEVGTAEWLQRYHNWVLVQHQDGSQFMLNYAFVIFDPDDSGFVWVFTEHTGNLVFCREDLYTLRELANVPHVETDNGDAVSAESVPR